MNPVFVYIAAAYTFYQTCRDQSSAQRRGKAALNQRRKRRHERTNRVSREIEFCNVTMHIELYMD